MQMKQSSQQNIKRISKGGPDMTNSPEPKGALTPPGSPPLRVELNFPPPSSPVAPLTPDSAYMTEPTNQLNEVTKADDCIIEKNEPLIGARKRKASKVHRVESECIRSESTEGSLTCCVCHLHLDTLHEFTKHIRTHNKVIEVDDGTKLFECGICQKTLSSNSSLDRHMLVHSGERPFKCHICGTHFTTNGNMHRHIRGHYRNGGLSMGSESGDSDGGSEGRGEHSPFNKRKLEGENNFQPLKIAKINDSETDELSCPVCGLDQEDSSILEKHMEENHPEYHSAGGKSFSQLERTKNIFDKANSQLCFNSATQPECKNCGIKFDKVESWFLHLREHQASPQFKCNKCDLSFHTLGEFSYHCERHEEESKNAKTSFYETLSKCSPSIAFYEGHPLQMLQNPVLSLKSPDKNMSEDITSISRIPLGSQTSLSHEEQFARDYRDMKLNGQYPCRLCKEIFANLRKLKSHNLVHMIAPPYQCNLCSFVSNDKNTLKEHMKNHKGDTPYECNLCSLSFTTKANCERHIKNIHTKQTREEIKQCMTYTPQDDRHSVNDKCQDTICSVCSIDCKSKSVLRDHMRSSHPEKVNKPFACKICKVSFSSNNETLRHVIHSHSEVENAANMDNFVERRLFGDDPHDLSSVESLLTLSKFQIPQIPLSSSSKINNPETQVMRNPTQLVSSDIFNINPLPSPKFNNSVTIMPSSYSTAPSPYVSSSESEDTPLDLSMGNRKNEYNSNEREDWIHNKPEDLSTKGVRTFEKNLLNRPSLSPSKLPSPSLNLLYPTQFPVPSLYPFSNPFFVHPFGMMPPVTNIDPVLFEQYRKDIRREILAKTGGEALNSTKNRLIESTQSPFNLTSPISLVVPKHDQSISTKSLENINIEEPQRTSTPKPSNDILHFTMRNSVLVKKPKQRRYRTARPWKCDICEKGFTLRSNMERHMKQQHPDIWLNKGKGYIQKFTTELQQSISFEDIKPSLDSDAKVEADSRTDKQIEEEENDLIIDDEEEWYTDECENDTDKSGVEEGADLASVHKLLSTASAQNFSFPKDSEESDQSDDKQISGDSLSGDQMSDDAKKSAYSSAPQKQKCSYCDRKFPWSSSLVRHIRTHTGQKPYLCPVCAFAFTTKSNCDRHLQRKHPNSSLLLEGDRPHKCSKCPSSAFTSLESLKKHKKFRHERLSLLHKKTYQCQATESCPLSTADNHDKICAGDRSTCNHDLLSASETEKSEMLEIKSDVDDSTLKDTTEEGKNSAFISNMLGTKPAVIDHLINSKSVSDAAKLLGVH